MEQPRTSDEWYRLGAKLATEGQWSLAEMCIRRALLEAPDNLAWRVALIRVLLPQRKAHDAVALVSEFDVPEFDPRMCATLALCFWRAGYGERALDAIARAVRGVPDPSPMWHAMQAEIEAWRSRGGPVQHELSEVFYNRGYEVLEVYDNETGPYSVIWSEICDSIIQHKAAKVLDIGCGPGQFADFLLTRIPDLEYTGLDFSNVAVEKARARCPNARFLCADVLKYNPAEEFDVVICTEVLEHIHADVEVICNLPKRLRFIGSVPNFESFGHVRFFINETEVRDRYGRCLDNFGVRRIVISPQASLFLLEGVT